ncbi:CLUMA_CG001738, isoform A [Clunio marinus]|uniref:CLUMA_CG001738, isoform A n=1 Tax=Clunio marinus TaxID=568069 RepID=A0A1J1HIS5_9DIPT|nr:CLUMA_CG001738, isoform A [Clunio marinus]
MVHLNFMCHNICILFYHKPTTTSAATNITLKLFSELLFFNHQLLLLCYFDIRSAFVTNAGDGTEDVSTLRFPYLIFMTMIIKKTSFTSDIIFWFFCLLHSEFFIQAFVGDVSATMNGGGRKRQKKLLKEVKSQGNHLTLIKKGT